MTDKPLVAITGASSGIGEATAKAFAEAGHPLLLMARRKDRMEALGLAVAEIAEVDVRDRGAIAAAVQRAEARFGPVDLMFANAGVAHLADIARQPPEEWDEMIDINTKGLMNAVHAVLKPMKERSTGTIVLMSSIAGRKTYPDHTVYCGTKFFTHAVGESLREYLAPHGVRVQVISPGVIETEVLSGVNDPETLKNYRENKVKMGGGIPASHVAELILSTYQMPQNALVQEIVLTPTRQSY
ncbi:probable oxidoreductase protein, short-chain dehydrogenase-reductase family [Fulvimarina pelagi HTCC2506]|uniref:Probable oxidoreductase protein, short-chain dehydrogenase-reductase family n=1 Tax=Fulvimarina pelagi HTCC2506 TaxID=314231 RepID=Q0FXG3_9HYPH|nr:SDR family oxidoreductase [Fulvimarina pelagi]EAU39687.1 probable oxidoreductase protein, short-chain dehydrogenase-reductase family [Fulvimarina pelagi HTCC2506]